MNVHALSLNIHVKMFYCMLKNGKPLMNFCNGIKESGALAVTRGVVCAHIAVCCEEDIKNTRLSVHIHNINPQM